MEIVKDKTKQAHGMTHSEMEELHQKQIHGDVEMVAANNAGDNIKDEYFKASYAEHKIPAHEKHVYHVAVESRMFDQNTGEKSSTSTVKKFGPEAFEFMKKQEAFKGQTVHILHNPALDEMKGKEKKAAQQENVGGGAQVPVETPEAKAKRLQEEEKATRAGLESMTVDQLKEVYTSETGNPAPSKIVKAELIDDIIEAHAKNAESKKK
jgi:hypothetical protein